MNSQIHPFIRYYNPQLLFTPELQIVEFTIKHLKGKKLLDAGCGNGWLSLALVQEGYHIASLDVSKHSIQETRYGFRLSNLDGHVIVQASITDIPFENDSFDSIICINVLEHVKNVAKTLRELNRILKCTGHLIIMVPNSTTFGRIYDSFLYRYLPAEAIFRKSRRVMFKLTDIEAMILDKEVPIGHEQKFSFKHITTLLTKNNFRIVSFRNFRFLGPYLRSLTNLLGIPPVSLLERFDLKIAQKVPFFIASEWFFCCEKFQ
jgi:2-polyprenyl-3-methyl-5-hydroxy-6-metoxy-1,4-benzoquinol methylase